MKLLPFAIIAVAICVSGCRRETPAYNDYPMKLGASDVSHPDQSK